MIIRSKAPLRLGLAGGGTDVSPYSDIYGGAILNATISLFANASLEPLDNGKIEFVALDRNEQIVFDSADVLEVGDMLPLHIGVYNKIVKDFSKKPLSFRLTTYVDAPAGSGLGTSSTLMVAILGAFVEWLNLPLGEYDIAQLAYDIERVDLGMAGGKQDQYAATFGGVNMMEFLKDNRVIVNPLRIKPEYLHELSHNLVLYYTKTSRFSSDIISSQSKSVTDKNESAINAMHKLKEQAVMMKRALAVGDVNKVGEILDFGWKHKKLMAKGISSPMIDEIYDSAIKNGATGGKISGAGGGGFMIFYCPRNTKYQVIEALSKFGGSVHPYIFTEGGLRTWTI